NEWSWHTGPERPTLQQVAAGPTRSVVKAVHPAIGERYLYCEGDAPLLFTENETNTQQIFGVPNRSRYVKDGINDHVVHGREGVVNPDKTGTKVAAHRSEEHTSELQSPYDLVCRLLLEKKK